MAEKEDPTSPLSPLAPYPPIPSPEYRSRAPEFYGFVAWTSTSFLYFIYILWALLPDEYIQWLGIKWYPSREWAVLVPAWSIVLALLTYFIYFALALFGTPAFSNMSAIIDSRAHLPPINRERNPYLQYASPGVVPDLYDIPIGLVNRVCYSPPSRCPPQ
ncbi:PIG-P-domain-containing protein [Mycena albidolilacea]|uniref:PIG-P-domain-containing protein n=1 Tax=Mycena albidolilacea TaxID=1033008 RepID=A0AAD7F0Y1_9AGAR|nr:PIG-P-domain-containing protein [Mycena albidolilacea]